MKRVGPYTLDEHLGDGGASSVYLTHKGADRTKLVIKIGKAQDAADFIKEATLLRRLNHPNVVRIFDAGAQRSRVYIVMEYVSGGDAHALLAQSRSQRQPLPAAVALLMARDIARGLAATHALSDERGSYNVVHRDVSPGNVLLSLAGDVKLADFGTAKWARAEVQTSTGVIRGKFEYLAPEQARGEALDARCDLFALGLVFYEALVGCRAYEAVDPYELIELASACAYKPIDADTRKHHPALCALLDRLLAPRLRDRPATAKAAADALDKLLVGEDEAALRKALAERVASLPAKPHAPPK